jgi:agmatine deiminase
VLRESDVVLERVQFWSAETARSWTRDTFPTWLVGPKGELGAVKWRFNAWARYPDFAEDEAAARAVADQSADALWLPEATKGERFVLEGGAIEGDGEGTLLTTETCLLGQEFPRNPGLSKSELESKLSDYLAIDKTIWIPGGIAGDDTSGHVDDLARFVSPGRVVVARETRSSDENYEPLEAARESLLGQSDARGRKLEVIDLPMPEPRAFAGQRVPASYANFLITNEEVLVPTFNDPADRKALGILSELFPGRRVVGIYSGDLVLGLGAIHCSSHHEPRAR